MQWNSWKAEKWVLKAAREMWLVKYRESLLRLIVASSSRNYGSIKQWNDIFKSAEKKTQPRTLYPAKLFFKKKGEIKILQINKNESFLCYQTCPISDNNGI